MNSTIASAEKWFDEQKANGLVDIKLAITNTRGASVRTVLDDLLNIETLASAGRVQELPGPEVMIPHDIKAIIDSVTI